VAVFSPIHPSLIIVQFDSIDIELTYLLRCAESFLRISFAASQEIPRILWNPKIHYRIQSVRQLSLSCARPIQSTYPHPTSWRSITILSTHPRLGLPSSLFASSFPTKTLYAPSTPPYAPNAQPIIDIELVI